MSDARAAREARGWAIDELAAALHVSPATVRAWEAGRAPLPGAVVAWWMALPPLPAPAGPPIPPTQKDFERLVIARGDAIRPFAAALGLSYGTVWRWKRGHHHIAHPQMLAWLRLGAPPHWWPPPPPLSEAAAAAEAAAPAPAPVRRGRLRQLPPAPGPGWVWLADAGGWAPPAAHCEAEEDYQQVVGCDVCCWRTECAALAADRKGS